ncbi:MAG TPA: SDR family NAD(P)-dependent oxidoreductase, partial [Alphaproteobacteria bacterium]
VSCDVTDEASVKAALEKSAAANGAARVLVNCAGILIGKRVVGKDGPADLAHFQKVIGVNLIGSFNTMRLAAAEMAKLEPVDADGSRGVVINTASIAAWEGQIGQAAYSASKGGIVGMTLPAARDMGKIGIRVMAIAPGAVSTPMVGALTPEIQASLESAIPFPSRFVKADEFAKLVLHIVDNNMLNGSVIRLDGASRLAAK